MKPVLFLLAFSLLFCIPCALAQTPAAQDSTGQQKLSEHVFTKDMTVYVSDFELDAQDGALVR